MKEQNLLKNIPQLESDLKNFLGEKILKECPKTPVETDISVADFKKKYVEANRPVILRGLTAQWSAIQKWVRNILANVMAMLKSM